MTIKCNENITLRSISESDTENVLRWRNSKEVVQYFNYQAKVTVADHQKWLDTKVKTGNVYQFIIHDSYLRKDVGSVYLQDIDHENSKAEYGIFIGEKEALNKGIGSVVAKTIISFAFKNLKLNRLFLQVHADNVRAIKCYENVGFMKEELLRNNVFVNGKYCDIVIMGIMREDKM